MQDLWSEVDKDKVAILAVNPDDDADVIRDYWEEAGFTFTALRDEMGVQAVTPFGVRAFPTNYVIGPEGKVLWRSVGWDEAAVRKALGLGSN